MEVFVGLMSGTSIDAVDAVVASFATQRPQLVAGHSEPVPRTLRRALLELSTRPQQASLRTLGSLDARVGRLFARCALTAIRKSGLRGHDVIAIGSHGQTVYHCPTGRWPHTIQIGDPNLIAEITGIDTIADFRRRDIAAGGQGAPLAPAFHAQALGASDEHRVVVNVGGIANVTVLPSTNSHSPVIGFDTGPGNALLDAWSQHHIRRPMDRDGAWARGGRTDRRLLSILLEDEFFERPPPKSTGKDYFNAQWLEQRLVLAHKQPPPASVARTLVELTAVTIRDAVSRWAPMTTRVLLCGGGARNPLLRDALARQLVGRCLETTDDVGVPARWVEALAFAWLARQWVTGRPGNIPTVTGARHPVTLGALYRGRTQAGHSGEPGLSG